MDQIEAFYLLESIIGPAVALPNRSGDATFLCPACNHPKPHLEINVSKELYHCWICDFSARGHKYALNRLGYSKEALLFPDSVDQHGSVSDIEQLRQYLTKYARLLPKNEALLSDLPAGYDSLYFRRKSFEFRPGYNYLINNRKLTLFDIMKFNILFNPSERRILIPSCDAKFRLNYYVTRSIDRDNSYINPNVPKTDFIFNEHLINWKSELYIVEGVFDAIRSKRNVVPILGSMIKKDHKVFGAIVKRRTPVVLALDPDAFGKQCKMAELFVNNGIDVRSIDMRDADDDVGGLDEKVFDELDSNAKEMSITDIIMNRIGGYN